MSIGTGHGAAEPEPVPGEPQRPSKTWKLALVGLIGVYTSLAVYGLIANASAIGASTSTVAAKAPAAPGERASSAPGQATTGSPSVVKPSSLASVPAARTASSPAAQPLGIASIAAFGPEGTSDGDNPGVASRILDVSTDQPWYTQWYATPEFGGLRLGTGLLLDLGTTVTVADVRLVLGSEQGADVQVRVGNAPSLDLLTVASASGVGGAVRLTAATPAKGRYVLIWFTKLPPDGNGHYEVSVYNVFVDG